MAALFDSLTIFDNVAFGPREHQDLEPEALERLVADRLQEVGLPIGLEQKKPAELSGGQRKRVALARAIATVRALPGQTRQDIGQRARALAEQYAPDHVAAATLSVYATLLEGGA